MIKDTRVETKCVICGKEFVVYNSKNAKYCSKRCKDVVMFNYRNGTNFKTVEELESSIRYGVEHHNHPIAIRIPVGSPIYETSQSNTTECPVTSCNITQSGNTIAIIGVGNFYHKAVELSHAIHDAIHIFPTLVKPLCISSLDTDTLYELTKNHNIV
ncbi:MAG: hypothetical protein KHX57_03870, partial [Streptococcus sp.]|nr:hypothetical protein [Streptococcus sp.]